VVDLLVSLRVGLRGHLYPETKHRSISSTTLNLLGVVSNILEMVKQVLPFTFEFGKGNVVGNSRTDLVT
jgi:hypothetical protein